MEKNSPGLCQDLCAFLITWGWNCVRQQLHIRVKDDLTSVFSRFCSGEQRGGCHTVTEGTTTGAGDPPLPLALGMPRITGRETGECGLQKSRRRSLTSTLCYSYCVPQLRVAPRLTSLLYPVVTKPAKSTSNNERTRQVLVSRPRLESSLLFPNYVIEGK